MELFKIVGFSMFAVFLILILKETRKDVALALSIVAGVGILLFSITKLEIIVSMLDDLVLKSGINKEFFYIILKVTGISYIIEFTKNICVDAGQSALGTKVEIAGKVIVVTISLPLITSLITTLSSLL
ncbi:MAG: SpoIIIAC/SpoIIIAD family protein [Clostridia bacterium]